MGQSEESYFCPHCTCKVHQEEINSLRDTIKALFDELTHLKAKEEPANLAQEEINSLKDTIKALSDELTHLKAKKDPINLASASVGQVPVSTTKSVTPPKPPNLCLTDAIM